MANLFEEGLLTLKQAAKIVSEKFPDRQKGKNEIGKGVSCSTLFRWAKKGVGGVRLETVRVGRTIGTSRPALSRFFKKLADADQSAAPAQTAIGASRKRTVEIAAAEQILARAGVG